VDEDGGLSSVQFLHDRIQFRVSKIDSVCIAEESNSSEFELVETVLKTNIVKWSYISGRGRLSHLYFS
jgi:hypothetical protein